LLLVERRKKEVLQDGFVEARLLAGSERVVALEQGCQLPFVEQRVGDEPLGFEEPAEQQARDETDEALLDVGVAVVNFGRHRELHLRCRPEEPVGDLLVELAREAFDIEGVVESLGDFGDGGFLVLQAEVEFGEPFEGGACGCAEGVGQRAQFGFAVGSLPRPCERHGRGDACLADDIAQQVFGVGGREGALHGAPRGEGRRALFVPADAEHGQTCDLRDGFEG
jgi:hypothetical protein